MLKYIDHLNPGTRKILIILIDALIFFFSQYFSFKYLFFSNIISNQQAYSWLISYGIFLYLFFNLIQGQYKVVTRYVSSQVIYRIAYIAFISLAITTFIGYFFIVKLPELKILVISYALIILFSSIIRIFLRDILNNFSKNNYSKKNTNIVIYGAGKAGAKLLNSLKLERNFNIKFFVDDDPSLWRRNLNGVKICSLHNLLNRATEIDQIFLAIPSLNRSQKKRIVEKLQKNGFSVLQIPSIDQMTSKAADILELKPILITDILGREDISPDPSLLGPGIINKNICVTGGGGSIGSELCRLILKLKPSKLIILENNEEKLYIINKELSLINKENITIKPILCNVKDFDHINKIFSTYSIDVVFHSAAYKHVPLVEFNPISGLYNNIFSTYSVCKASQVNKISQMVLISSDKAVRPHNIMGATKRISELIVQSFNIESKNALNSSNSQKTLFSMVRFGNVLDSSGSVVPLFRKQILSGGPITLTHKNIIRYFMTIKEACELVIQSSMLAEGGDVFLLDMGEPVLIKDLAEKMINLSGLKVKNRKNPEGDIEIKIIGLRPGEKMYEELLIDDKAESTQHPLIFKANENFIEPMLLHKKLLELENFLKLCDVDNSLAILKSLLPEWERDLNYKKNYN